MSVNNLPTSAVAVTLRPVSPDFNDQSSDLTERKSPSAIFKNRKSNQLPLKNKSPQRLILLFQNQTFWSRILILFIILFLWLLCCIYTLAQILKLTLSNYLCPSKTLQEIHEHSIINNLPKGDQSETNSCWRAKQFTVNDAALWSNASYGADWDFNMFAIGKNIAFFILSALFLICIIQTIIVLVADIIRYRKHKLGKWYYEKQLKKQRKSKLKKTHWYSFMMSPIHKLLNWQKRNWIVDSGNWIVFSICREMFEIILQSQALLLYNGINIFNWYEVFLANEQKYIQLFAIFIFLNCITSGILWICYAFNPIFCHGLMFEYILYSCDAIFDVFYALYPLIIVLSSTDASSFTIAVASLQTNTQIGFWATFVPLIFLCLKFWTLASKSSISMKRYYAKIYLQSLIDKKKTANNVSNQAQILNDFASAISRKSEHNHSAVLSNASMELQKIFDLVMLDISAQNEKDKSNDNQDTTISPDGIDMNEEDMVYIDYTPRCSKKISIKCIEITEFVETKNKNTTCTELKTPILSEHKSNGSISDSLTIPDVNICDLDINLQNDTLTPPMPKVNVSLTSKITIITPSTNSNKNSLSVIGGDSIDDGSINTKNTQLTVIPIPLMPQYSTTSWILDDSKKNINNLKKLNQKMFNDTQNNTAQNDTQNDIQTSFIKELQIKWETRYTKKLIFVLISFLFLAYGMYLLKAVLSHFNSAEKYCNSLVQQRIKFDRNNQTQNLKHNNSELFLFDYCDFPVYPFSLNSDICQCRNFRISFIENWNLTIEDMNYYFNTNIVHVLMNVLKKWYMLEKVQIHNVNVLYKNKSARPLFNFTSDMFTAQRLRVFEFNQVSTYYIDNSISKWKELVYFSFTENNVLYLPKTFGELSSL
eukprot:431760_1